MALKRNLTANFISQVFNAVISVAFVPLYIQFLGIEAYALVGFFTVLQVWFALLDAGMKPTITREAADHETDQSSQKFRDLLRSFEIITIALGIAILTAFLFMSGPMSESWFNASELDADEIMFSVVIMAFIIVLRFPLGLYQGALIGLNRQVELSIVSIILSSLRNPGVVLVLWLIDSSPTAFFVWQAIVACLGLILNRVLVYRYMRPGSRRSRFSRSAVRKIGRFAIGVAGINLIALLLSQLDKLLLSKMLPMTDFGYYMFATTVAMSLYSLIAPITQAFYPGFVQAQTAGNQKQLMRDFRLASKMVTFVIAPIVITLAIFPEQLIFAWSGNESLASNAAPILRVLAIGTFLNATMQVPYYLQLANGWTSLTFRFNLFMLLFLIPALFYFVPKYGAISAAWIWLALNAAYLTIQAPIVFHRLAKGELSTWYYRDIIAPSTSALIPSLIINYLAPLEHLNRVAQAGVVMSAYAMSVGIILVSEPDVRKRTKSIIQEKLSPSRIN